MRWFDIIKSIMEKKEVNGAMLCNRTGLSSPALYGRFKQENISIDKLNQLMKVMDYRLVAMPIDKKLPDGAYVIDTKE